MKLPTYGCELAYYSSILYRLVDSSILRAFQVHIFGLAYAIQNTLPVSDCQYRSATGEETLVNNNQGF
jgi:hypothetical protein